MTTTTISSRNFNQSLNRVKTSARTGPVFIADQSKPSYELLSIEQYEALTGGRASVVDLLAMPEVGGIECEPPMGLPLVVPNLSTGLI